MVSELNDTKVFLLLFSFLLLIKIVIVKLKTKKMIERINTKKIALNRNLKSEIMLFEFEWYLRDYFFRLNNNNNQKVTHKYQMEEISNNIHNNYLRYKNVDIDQIKTLLNKVLLRLQEKNIIKIDIVNNTIELFDYFQRKQCSECHYVNYLSQKEELVCHRCKSSKIKEFAFNKKTNAK